LAQLSTAVDIFFHNGNLKISLFFFEFQKILKEGIFFAGRNIKGGKETITEWIP